MKSGCYNNNKLQKLEIGKEKFAHLVVAFDIFVKITILKRYQCGKRSIQ
jgi:hypothetical protein